MDYASMTGDNRKKRTADRAQSMVANADKTAGANGLSGAHKLKGPLNTEENNLASGGRAKPRADRFARGGAVNGHKAGDPKTRISININATPPKEDKPDPMAALAALAGSAPPPPPPAGGPPMPMAGGPPPGLPGMGMGMKTGGKVKSPDMEGGAGGALGRLEKTTDQKRIRRKGD